MRSVFISISNRKPGGFKLWFCLTLIAFLTAQKAGAGHEQATLMETKADEPPVSMIEMRYEKLMKLYLNKIKLAFSETEEARSLEVLNGFLPEFTQRSDGLKKEIQETVKGMTPQQTESFYLRLRQRSHTEELVALLFDERVTSRMNANAEIKYVMDQLHAKSLEIQQSGQGFIAVEK